MTASTVCIAVAFSLYSLNCSLGLGELMINGELMIGGLKKTLTITICQLF